MESLITVAALIALGYIFGRIAETRHYQSIQVREQAFLGLPTTSSKKSMSNLGPISHAHLVQGNVVISVDYFKRFLATLRNIFGGTLQAYETLLDRARREAVLRLKESCPDADQIINLRLETSSISKGDNERIGSVEVLAYGTAIYLQDKTIQDTTR
ncbi:YbjQ family protein [Candidatus Nitrospira salsa]|nr:MAG: metal-binding protein [Nitrospirales bacterium]